MESSGIRDSVLKRVKCSEKDAEKIESLFMKREYQAKKHLINIGEKWDKIWFVGKGIIRLFYIDEDGREFNKGFFSENDFLWPVAPSIRGKNSIFVIAAMEDIIVYSCEFSLFFKTLETLGIWEKFALYDAEKLVEEKFLREYEFLTLSAKERYENFLKKHYELSQRIPDYHIASYLGITNVSLSRLRKNRI